LVFGMGVFFEDLAIREVGGHAGDLRQEPAIPGNKNAVAPVRHFLSL